MTQRDDIREDITELLQAWRAGEKGSEEKLLAVVYEELRTLARRYLARERGDHTLQPTALVHEAYFRLCRQQKTDWQDRGHFFAVAAQAMRRILVDHARKLRYATVKEPWRKIPLAAASDLLTERPADLLALDDSLSDLASLDPRKAQIVELRFFGGLSLEETAAALGCSRPTVVRQWRLAKTWLYLAMSQEEVAV